MPKLADLYTCTGCVACVDSCPTNALTTTINSEGHLSYKLDPSICVECKKCEKVCPIVSAYEYGNNEWNLSHPYACWSKDSALRAKSTSGGIFASVAKLIIEQGGLAVGAYIDGYKVYHICIENIDDLPKIQGSKYTQSDTTGIFIKVKEELGKGRKVLFSGVGCQVAAILKFLKGNKNIKNLYTIDLICGGVPTSFLIDKFADNHYNQYKGIVAFRNKIKYQLTVVDMDDNKIDIPTQEKPLPLSGFCSESTNRYSCYDCKFAFAHRCSDITIGDFWGDIKFPNQHQNGLSVAVVHNQNGIDLLTNADLNFEPILWADFVIRNFRMVDGKMHYNHRLRNNLSYAFKHYSYNKLQRIYGNKISLRNPLDLLNKVRTVLFEKVRLKIKRIKVRALLNKK